MSSVHLPKDWLFTKSDLTDRLLHSGKGQGKKVNLLLGSAVSAAANKDYRGVPFASEIVDLIRARLSERQLVDFEEQLRGEDDQYQRAFRFIVGRQGQDAANAIIREAVATARKSAEHAVGGTSSDDMCRALENDISGWTLSPALDAVGKLVAFAPEHFGGSILTTNFDPLIQVAIKSHGGSSHRMVLDTDGRLNNVVAEGANVVHLHGYWFGADTLHTTAQLSLPRPQLKSSLTTILKSNILLVSGYGGWDDVFTATLKEVLMDGDARPDVLWTFHGAEPQVTPALLDMLQSGVQRGRLSIYAGIDCHSFFPELASVWDLKQAVVPTIDTVSSTTSNKVALVSERRGQDRPPLVEHFVGRSAELARMREYSGSVTFVSGIGGQGKSALAAAYFNEAEKSGNYRHCIWRDCKEEGEHFERQLASIISGLVGPEVSEYELARRPIDELSQLVIELCEKNAVVVTFDNIDFYIDLENNALSGGMATFIRKACSSRSRSRFIFTCRPEISVQEEIDLLHLHLSGLSEQEAEELFSRRRAIVDQASIHRAHKHTQGHALWLDLLAAQVAREGSHRLDDLLQTSEGADNGTIPRETLDSIWGTLKDREKLVLRTLAESVRPASEVELEGYLNGRLRFNQMTKATRYLRTLGLLVIKQQKDGELYHELHPLIRTYIKQTFPQEERKDFITAIINFYNGLIQIVSPRDTSGATEKVQRISEVAELRLESGDVSGALETIAEAHGALSASDQPQGYVRAASRVLSRIDWQNASDYQTLDSVVDELSDVLSQLGRFDEARKHLSKWRETIKSKTARYVRYCKAMCNLEWLAGDYKAAIEWGEEGDALRKKSGADVPFDPSHYLALARRDKGEVEPALKYFLRGSKIEDVLRPDFTDEEKDGPFYGNIGRCFQKLDQFDNALICFRKSAVLIEETRGGSHVANQAYIRQWAAEAMLERGEYCQAKNFFEAALAKWAHVSPVKANKILEVLNTISDRLTDCVPLASEQLERNFRDWAYERHSGVRL
jgi:tetratricopeptide (TPR) repeat protein